MEKIISQIEHLGAMIKIAKIDVLHDVMKVPGPPIPKLTNGLSMNLVKPPDTQATKVLGAKRPLFTSSLNTNSPYNLR